MDREKRIAYLRNPSGCPYCGGEKVERSLVEFIDDARQITVLIECHGCGKEWSCVYELDEIEEQTDR